MKTPTLCLVLCLVSLLLLTACGRDGGKPESSDSPESGVQTTASNAATTATIRQALGKIGRVGDVAATRWPGVYMAFLDGRVVHTNADGSLIFVGDMYRAADQSNITAEFLSKRRASALAALKARDSVDFKPEGDTKHVVWVFTDVDCGYCQRMHVQMKQYNELGIEVRYLPYPRAGENSDSWRVAEQIWCADDRKQTLTQAKLSRGDMNNAPLGECDAEMVARGYRLGQELGLRGTPMIIDERGYQVGGYVPPQELIKALDNPPG